MDMSNPTYGWEMDSFESMMGEDWTSFEMSNDLHLDDSLDSDWEWSSSSSSSSSASSYESSSEYISSEEWTTSEQESSMTLSAWFINTEEHWVVNEPHGLSTDALIHGVSGFYQVDRSLYPNDQSPEWHTVEIQWDPDTESFWWQVSCGVRWHLQPVHKWDGIEWDTTTLTVEQNGNPYYDEGYHTASVEWVSSE